MNIQCEWESNWPSGGRMIVKRYNHQIAYMSVGHGEEPSLTVTEHSANISFTVSELEHIMDNWNNLSKSS